LARDFPKADRGETTEQKARPGVEIGQRIEEIKGFKCWCKGQKCREIRINAVLLDRKYPNPREKKEKNLGVRTEKKESQERKGKEVWVSVKGSLGGG